MQDKAFPEADLLGDWHVHFEVGRNEIDPLHLFIHDRGGAHGVLLHQAGLQLGEGSDIFLGEGHDGHVAFRVDLCLLLHKCRREELVGSNGGLGELDPLVGVQIARPLRRGQLPLQILPVTSHDGVNICGVLALDRSQLLLVDGLIVGQVPRRCGRCG